MLIGITGGIGSGKSTIAAELAKRGYPVYDTDREAKRIIVHNPAVRSQIETLFGSDVFDGDTYLTDKVAAQVFADSDLLHRLNAIVHPAVKFDLQHWVKWHNEQINDKIVNLFVESAILFESGLDTLCDEVVYVDAPEEVRIARTVARDHTTPERVREIINHQINRPIANRPIVTLFNDGNTPIPTLVEQLLDAISS